MYVLTNLTDDKLNELSAAIHEEKKRRFLEKEWIKPEVRQLVMQLKHDGTCSVEANKIVRERFNYSMMEAFIAIREGDKEK